MHVQPNARANAVAGLHGDALKVKIASPPVDDKANAALVDFLHDLLDVPAAMIRVRRGAHGRRKIVEIVNAEAALLTRLKALGTG